MEKIQKYLIIYFTLNKFNNKIEALQNKGKSMPALLSINPIDGRYHYLTKELQPICSEFALLKLRLLVESSWLITLAKLTGKPKPQALNFLHNLNKNFSLTDAAEIKSIEQKINHDSKAVEYFLRSKIAAYKEWHKYSELIHLGCTSDDISNIAYALMIKELRDHHLLPTMKKIIKQLQIMATQYAEVAMLARTHGQIATPTTMGKELANFVVRLKKQYQQCANIKISAKFNGTVGNFNAHIAAFPNFNWLKISRNFVQQFGLTWNLHTTQIEPHDYLVELSDALKRFNHILIGLNRDIWGYIALGYFKQKMVTAEVGSSVMPHKINPIDFENAEGNLGLANALFQHFSDKLLISRWQRDLSDSTVLRNIGSSFAYSLIAYKSLLKGLTKLAINHDKINQELNQHWEVLAEAIQTTMRRFKINNSYEKLKAVTRGHKVSRKTLHHFIHQLAIPKSAKQKLLKLTPANYLGLAKILTKKT